MDYEAEGGAYGLHWPTEHTLSTSMSQQSSQSYPKNFPLMTSDSGLYTCCSSNNSDAALESDTDSCHIITNSIKDESLQTALRDVRRLRSELERLTKSEQWYKQELRHQKSNRLEDLERIYAQERKYMQDNQRLQKECVRLYEKCSELETEIQKQQLDISKESQSDDTLYIENDDTVQFEVEQQKAIIQDQQQLIDILRKQKKALLNDLRSLTEEKDEKVMELQKHLADLEFDNKRITKKCAELSKERSKLTCTLRQSDSKLSLVLDEKLGLQKSLVSLREQLEIQEKLVRIKESEISQIQNEFKDNMNKEQNLDEVHRLSLKYHEEINSKSLEIIKLKSQMSNMQEEMESLQELQVQNDQQQRHIEQLNFSLEACQMELQEIKQSDLLKTNQIDDLQWKTEKLLQDNDEKHKQMLQQKLDFDNVCQELKTTNEKYKFVQERYKETQFKLEMLEIEQSKLCFQNKNDQKEIQQLRVKLSKYLQQTSELVEKIRSLELELKRNVDNNVLLKKEFEQLQGELQSLKSETNCVNEVNNRDTVESNNDFLELSTEFKRLQNTLDQHNNALMPTPPVTSIPLQTTDKQCKRLMEKEIAMFALHNKQQPNECMEKLLHENESLKKRIEEVENESNSLQLKQDISGMTQKCIGLETLLQKQELKEKDLQKQLLLNDSKLYKVERRLKNLQDTESISAELLDENRLLKDSLTKERLLKTELNTQLTLVKDQVESMKTTLEDLQSKQKRTSHKSVQCDEIDKPHEDISAEVVFLKEQIVALQNKQKQIEEVESQKSEERLQLLRNLSDLQNSKMQSIQSSQQDWEDMLKSLNTVQCMEEQTRRELELKRMELEELNQVFAEQNEELKKLEELTALLEIKRHAEKEQLKQTFQKEISVMKQQLLEYQQIVQKEQKKNIQLQEENNRIQQNYDEDYAKDIAEYRREVRSLKTKIERTVCEKSEMLDRIRDLENELREIKNSRRDAVCLPQFSTSVKTSAEELHSDLAVIKSNVGDDHLRILTKVLEAEYARKMQRYDEHIHSLLTNVNSLKKSLKYNEEKTAFLSEEQSRTVEELKELQNTKRSLEDLRFKYEQSQSTIKV